MTPDLTEQERDALRLLAEGETHRDIGRRFQMSPHDLHALIEGACRKLGAVSEREAVERARGLGLVPS